MTSKLSQDYGVDNRYRGLEEAGDNTAGKKFLAQYMERDRKADAPDITTQRQGDDRFVLVAEGGTVPVAGLPYEPRGAASIGNTDRRISFRNLFRTEPS
jgi:hypothetical protein